MLAPLKYTFVTPKKLDTLYQEVIKVERVVLSQRFLIVSVYFCGCLIDRIRTLERVSVCVHMCISIHVVRCLTFGLILRDHCDCQTFFENNAELVDEFVVLCDQVPNNLETAGTGARLICQRREVGLDRTSRRRCRL